VSFADVDLISHPSIENSIQNGNNHRTGAS